MEYAAREHGYAVFLVDTQESLEAEEHGVNNLIQRRVEGIIWCPLGKDTSIPGYDLNP